MSKKPVVKRESSELVSAKAWISRKEAMAEMLDTSEQVGRDLRQLAGSWGRFQHKLLRFMFSDEIVEKTRVDLLVLLRRRKQR